MPRQGSPREVLTNFLGKNNLSFNWRLILGPEYVLEYVVVHEMVHLENKKHNNSFWSRVSDIYSDYKKGYNWLEENSHLLVFL